jgi:hypothetical protein
VSQQANLSDEDWCDFIHAMAPVLFALTLMSTRSCAMAAASSSKRNAVSSLLSAQLQRQSRCAVLDTMQDK